MKTKHHFIFLVMTVMALTACMKSAENLAEITKGIQEKGPGALSMINKFSLTDTAVYVAGDVTDSATEHTSAVYWKNGVMNVLSSPGEDALATGIAVVGNNVYVCGYSATNAGVLTGVYWVNGVEKRLPDNTIANGIAVNSFTGSVFVSGVIISNTIGRQAAYWKDGVQVSLAPKSNISHANGIFLIGSDAYIAGDINNSAVYWKNGVVTNLSGSLSGSARAILSDGFNVYAAGNTTDQGVATFWKNGLTQQLTDPSTIGDAFGIAIGTTKTTTPTTFVAGNHLTATGFIGTYWQDGVLKTIPGSAGFSAVALLGNDLYLAGFADGAAYWKNGMIKKLARNGDASGMQVIVTRRPVPVNSRAF